MEVRCIGETLWRSGAYPIQSFLAPSLSTAWRSRLSTGSSHHEHTRSQRCFSTSVGFRAEDSSPKSTSEKPSQSSDQRAKLKDIFKLSREQQPPSAVYRQSMSRANTNPRINAKLDELFPSDASSTQPSSRTVTEVTNAFDSWSEKHRGMRPGSIASSMLMPNGKDGSMGYQRNITEVHASELPKMRNKRTIRSRPTVGRTIEVDEKMGVDLGRALSKLAMLCKNNNVKDDQKAQRYHERPGLKRKRLKHDRWRRYFRTGFEAMVQRAVQMRRQGW